MEGQRMQDDSSRFPDRNEPRESGYGGASGYSNVEIGPNRKLYSSSFPVLFTLLSNPSATRELHRPVTIKNIICYRLASASESS